MLKTLISFIISKIQESIKSFCVNWARITFFCIIKIGGSILINICVITQIFITSRIDQPIFKGP